MAPSRVHTSRDRMGVGAAELGVGGGGVWVCEGGWRRREAAAARWVGACAVACCVLGGVGELCRAVGR